MKSKKLVAILLCLAMILTTLTACSGNEGSSENNSSQSSESGISSSEVSEGEISADDLEPLDITMLMVSPMPNEDAYADIEAEMSKITQEKYNVTMHIMGVSIPDYTNKMNLALASGDKLDLFQGFTMYNQFVSMGYMLNLDPYEDLYQDALEVVGDTAVQCFYNGSRYGLPIINFGTNGGDAYAFRKDIIDELGIDLTDYPTLADLEEVLVMIKEAYPDVTPIMSGGAAPSLRPVGDPFSGVYFDGLGNTFVNIDPTDPDAKVEVNVKRDYYKQLIDLAWDWAQKGLIGYDEISGDMDNVKAGKSAALYIGDGPAVTTEASASGGQEMVVWTPQNMNRALISTNNVWTWCVTEYTPDPERAIMILNELYLNADLSNLLVWGIEGVDYQVVDEEQGLVDFIDGQNQSNVRYFNMIKDNIPNLYLCYQGVHDIPNKYKAYQDWKTNKMEVSPYLGFVPDEDAYANESAACTNVINQYTAALQSGQMNPDEGYDRMIQELDAAGIETIREEIQKQLDAWVAENAQ